MATSPDPEIEAYPGQIEWYSVADGQGQRYRFGFVELTDRAGQRFWGGANRSYRVVVLLDGKGIGYAYPFRVGNGQNGDYLSPEYVGEKLGSALPFRRDVRSFTRILALLLNRPTVSGKKETP